jgi:hypothetical protein
MTVQPSTSPLSTGRMPTWCCLGLVLTGMVCSSCARDGTSADDAPSRAASLAQMRQDLRAIETRMTCERRVRLHDDVWFWDRAVGIVCQGESGAVARAFVYRTPGSAEASAIEQGVDQDSAVVIDDRLLISGDRVLVEAIHEQIPDQPGVRRSVQDDADLDPVQDDVTFCARAVAAHAVGAAEGDVEPASDVADLDSLYPGYAARVAEVDDEIRRSSLARLLEQDALAFEGGLSRLGPATKAMCARRVNGS